MKVLINELNGWYIDGVKHAPGSVVEVSESVYKSAVDAGLKIEKVSEKSETKTESGKSK